MQGVSRSADRDAAAVQAPLRTAETSARRTTRSLTRQQSAYEDRARAIQKHINSCREAYRDAKDFIQDFPPTASDTAERTAELVKQYRTNISQLKLFANNYDAILVEWDGLADSHDIPDGTSEWAALMRDDHDRFLAQEPNLSAHFRQLIATYRDYLGHVQRSADTLSPLPPSPELGLGVQPTMPAPSRASRKAPAEAGPTPRLRFPENSSDDDEQASTDTHASNGADGQVQQSDAFGPADNAGEDHSLDPPEEQQPTAAHDTTPEAQQQRHVHFREEPDEVHDLRDLSLRSEDNDSDLEYHEAPLGPPLRSTRAGSGAHENRRTDQTPRASRQSSPPAARRPRPLYYGNSSMYGLFAHSDGLLSEARPVTVQNTHAGYKQHQRHRSNDRPASSAWNYHVREEERYERVRRSPLYPASFPAVKTAPDYRAADNAAGTTGDGYRSRRESRFRSPSPTRASEAEHRDPWHHDFLRDAARAGRGRSSGPTYASADRAYRPQQPAVDHGVDFGHENASRFYQNAVFVRNSSASNQPLALKELPIQKFGGDIRAYPAFRNHFLELVENRKDIAPRHKLQYLLQCLTNEPLQEAQRYMITDANYFKAIDRLETKYGNQRKLLMTLNRCFLDLKSPSTQSASDVRRFHDEVRHLCDEMHQIGEDADKASVWAQTFVTKLPPSLRQKVFEKIPGDPRHASVSELLNSLAAHLLTLEAGDDFALPYNTSTSSHGNSGKESRQCRPDPRSTAYRAGTYATEADVTYATNTQNRRCAYCGRDHWSLKCDVYATITQRIRRLQQLGFCFLCLKGGHRTGTCPKRTNEPCRFCKNTQHHQSICRSAIPARRPPLARTHQNPVCATMPGQTGILKKEPTGSSSSPQQARGYTPVNRAGVTVMPPATTPCPPSAQISSTTVESNSKQNRRKKSKGKRTGPNGRDGTTCPTTAYVDENVTQMDANACGGAGLLPMHPGHLKTDMRSTPAEAQWYDHTTVDGPGERTGFPDGYRNRGPLDAEEASLPDSTGHCSDAETEPPAEEQWADDPSWFGLTDAQDYSGYAISTTSPADNNAVLLECLRTTAVNVNNGLTRPAIVFFDSGSNISYIGMKLARELQLPYLEKRLMRVNTFGTDVVTTVEGFATTVLLRSPQGASVALTLTASDRIVPPVTTALVADDEVQLLKKNKCALVSTREKPDLLIGQDLFHLFERRFGPQLPNGFHVTWTCLGPVAGGAGKVAGNRKAATTTHAAATSDPEPPSDTTTKPPSTSEQQPPPQSLGYNPEDPLNLWTVDDTPGPADNAGPVVEKPDSVPADNAGSEPGNSTVVDASTFLCGLPSDPDAALFGDFSHVENAGIGTSEMTPDDQAAADMLKKIHKRHPDGRYEVPLLFRTPDGEPPSNEELPTNAHLARGRSFSTRKMLVPHAKKLLDYHSVILDWKERGFIKVAPKGTPHTKHLLSHHPVFKETSTTTATRPVYDASAKLPGRTCLNDWLYRGPTSLPDVPAILLRSRPPKIVILADISKAFLQMEVKESHKDCLRFYWFLDPFKEPTEDNIVEYRFERVPFGLKSAPYLLAGVIKLHLESVGTPLALEMLTNCYVDNVLLTADTVTEALAKYREAKEIFAQIGMPLREFASNSAEFNAAIDPADKADLTKLKELGIRWDILSDYWDIPLMPKQAPHADNAGGQACLAASTSVREPPADNAGTHGPVAATQKKRKGRKKKDDGRLSKRSMLRFIARIFDPQGLVQAATLLAKLVIQETWRRDKDWDDEISGDLAELWNEAIKNFATTVIRVPRRISKGKIKSVEIHVFTDGSSYAYGFTSYLRIKNADGTYSTNLVYTRARVKPIKDAEKFTIPRMELLGVLLGTRNAAFLHKELHIRITDTYLWSDSTIVLHQIANTEAIKEVWTENRLKEIRRLRDSLPIQFRHVPTEDNPADIVSRGISAAELQNCEKWWHGPPFLALNSSRWPEQPQTLRTKPSPSDQPTELYGTTAFTTLFVGQSTQPNSQWIRQRSQRKKENPLDTITEPRLPTSTTYLAVAAVANTADNAVKPPKLPSEPILPRQMEEKYDRWPRLVRVQYYVVRFAAAGLRIISRSLARRNKTRRHAPALGFDMGQCFTTHGRKPTLRDLQLVTMIILRKTQLRHPPSAADRRDLGIFESQGLLYVKGRLGNMKLRPTALTPLFLPREARETELIILEYHRINGHAGGANTLANLRMRYWFTRGRITVRNVLRKYCFACRRESMQPFAVPPWPQLPTSRVTNARPFYFTGLDFFGPVYLRAPNGSGGYYVSKYYVCIFVCMTLRCIHLELCDDLSTDAFLHALKRFGYRREFPCRILSDNGLSFITAREVINRIRGRPAHPQPGQRIQPVRKVVSARLAAHTTPAPTASSSAHGTQQQRPADNAGRLQQRGHADNAGPSAALAPRGHPPTPNDAILTRDEERLLEFCQRHHIEWQTITELSPWKGGVYERLIGLIKHCLRRSIGKTKPTVVEFLSLLLCAEHTANCRPLSYVADSDTDFILIRPQDFLIPMLDQEAHKYPLDPAADDSTPEDPDFIGPGQNKLHAKIIKDLVKARRLADSFWKMFRDGVLLELRNRGIDGTHRPHGEATIEPGDLVLVSETDVPRSEWRLALVLELLTHSDGLARSARIRYATTKRETNRSLEHLYPIGKIPQSTAACSSVSRLGICLSVLLSDITSMPDNHYNGVDTVKTAASRHDVPITAARFNTNGTVLLTELRLPPAAPRADPPADQTRQSVKGTGAADNAAPLPAVAQGSGPADNAGPVSAPHAPTGSKTPSSSATIAEQNPSVPDTEAATNAQAAHQPSATPDAATSSATDASAIAAHAVNPATSAAITALEARIAPLLAGLAQLKASLLQPTTPMPGPSAPTRSPDTDPEHDA